MAIEWERPKDPSEQADYGINWLPDLGSDTVASSLWEPVSAAGTTAAVPAGTISADAKRTSVKLAGGNDGETALWRNSIVTASGNRLEAVRALRIVDTATVAATPTDLETLRADRAAIYSARLSFLTTGAVKEVSRSGRKLVKDNPTLKDFNDALALIDADIIAAQAAADGTRRRRAFTMSYR